MNSLRTNFTIKFLLLFVLSAVLLVAGIFFTGVNANTQKNRRQIQQASSLTSAQGAVLMEATTKRVLFEQNPHKKLPMASTTKIVTAFVICQTCNLEEVVEIPAEAVGIEGSSIYLRKGEHLTVRELLYGLMLRSGNDAAVALAIHASGSVDQFAQAMNKIAASVGATESNFVNPHGLHNDKHYTTAYDLAIITSSALQNNDFKDIVATKKYNIANEGYDYPRVLINKNKLLQSYEFCDGVKTGFTKKAGRCFVGSATKDDMQLVSVVLNCGPMFENARAMLENGFSCYTMTNIVPQNKLCGVVFKRDKAYFAYCEKSFDYPLLNDGSEDNMIKKSMSIPDGCEDMGLLQIEFNGETIFQQPLTMKSR